MTSLETTYMGMPLRTPLVPSASPLTADVTGVRRLEDAGAAAVVLASLFEEEISHHGREFHRALEIGAGCFAEALDYYPDLPAAAFGPDEHLRRVEDICRAVSIPVIASLNASNPGAWVEYAHLLEGTGIQGLELNIYFVAAEPDVDGQAVEARYREILQELTRATSLPVAVKLSPYFSALRAVATDLVRLGAQALVLFNRFYQPDVDLENLEVVPDLVLSRSFDARLALRWIAILHGSLDCSLAATTGVHTALDALKMVSVGADVTMLCSVLLKEGPGALRTIERQLQEWLDEHEYASLDQLRGTMSQRRCPNPEAFERANYMQLLRRYR